jgi:hypothetical protein
MRILAKGLTKKCFQVQATHSIVAKSSRGTIHIEPSGVCWSPSDPADFILPSIPDVLGSPKERLTTTELQSKYFKPLSRIGVIQLFPRIEISSNWEALRASGDCGLTPDEKLIVSSLLDGARGPCPLVTDFLAADSRPVVYGRKRYFESSVQSTEARGTLRAIGQKGVRNSYLPRHGLLKLPHPWPSPREMREALGQLDEWCYFNAS